MHHTYLCPYMDEASNMLKNIVDDQQQLTTSYLKFSPNPPLVDELVNQVPSSVSMVDQIVNFVSSLVDPIVKVIDLILSLVNPTLPLKSATQVIDLIPSLVDPTLPLKSETQVVDPVPHSIHPIAPSNNEDVTHVFIITMNSSIQGVIPPIPMIPPPSNAITIDWKDLTEPHLVSYMPFQIIVPVCGRNIPNTIIDKGASIRILSSNAW
jgi:hypothetical protein